QIKKVLVEDATKLDFYFTDSISGELGVLNATKSCVSINLLTIIL
ncbi:unnamed protein product, partial [marine sediment metagenome]